MNRQSGRIGLYLVLIVMLVAGYFYLNNQVTSQSSYSMESMKQAAEDGKVTSAKIYQNREVPTGSVVVDIEGEGQKRVYVTDVKDAEETESTRPHRTAGNDHGKFHITGSSKSISRYECHDPDKRLYNCDPHHHMKTHICTFFFHTTKDCDWFCQCKYAKTAYDDNNFCDHAEFFYVIDCFVFSSGTKALADDRHQTDSDADCRDTI